MSTLRLETYVPKAGVNKPKSKIGVAWDRLTKPAEEPPYRPLAENHIRVAKIKPGTKDQPLRVKLKHIDPRSTKYIALSYTWDQSPPPSADLVRNSSSDSQSTLHGTAAPAKPQTTTLLCGGTNFRVRQNLYDALCQIRDVQCDVPVFVDALCINFNDNAERSKYLDIMGQIYSKAASVIVFLGPKSLGADSTMRIMRQLVNAINWRRIDDLGSDGPSIYNFRDPYFFQSIGMEPLTLAQWRAIRDFCHLRWFTRYWSFFELALAKNALFLWGEACMDYKFLMDFCMILALSGWLDELRHIGTENFLSSTYHPPDGDVPLIKMLMPVSQLRSSAPWSPKHKDFVAWMNENHGLQSERAQAWQFFEILLQQAEPFDCLNPLDRMYAPLTLARTLYAGRSVNDVWPKADYQRSVAQVYEQFAGLIAKETGQYSIIAGMEGYTGPAPPIQPRTMNNNRGGARDRSADLRPAAPIQPPIKNDSRSGSRDASRDPGPSRGRDRDRDRDRSRHESANAVRTAPPTESRDRRRNESMNNIRPESALRHAERPGTSDDDPRFHTVNGTRFKNNFSQNRASTPDMNVPSTSKDTTPKSRKGKLISKRAPSRNG